MSPPLQRWALGLEYDGSAFHGYQVQANRSATVQQGLESALTSVAAEPIRLFCAGRTDAGVHATNQVVHFDTTAQRVPKAFVRGCNSLAPKGLSVRWAQPVPSSFHARFSARSRRYVYLLCEQTVRLAIGRSQIAVVPDTVDVDAMHIAAQQLVGAHDFSAFRGAGCQARSPIRTITLFEVRRAGSLVLFDVCANAFLLHMVRNLVGTLLRIGSGQANADWLREVLLQRDRRLAGPTAAPTGLYLCAVGYDADYGFDSGLRLPWFLGRS